jgi:hypothetical protein
MLFFLEDEPDHQHAGRALYRDNKVSFETTIGPWLTDM